MKPWEARLQARRSKQPMSEAERIVQLPVATPVDPARAEELSRENIQAGPYEGLCECDTCRGRPFRLLDDQTAGLHAFLSYPYGPFASIKVGGGKTGLCMLIASHHLRQYPEDKVLLLIPASIVTQFMLRDLPWGRSHLALGCSWYILGNRSASERRELARRGPGAYVLPYSCLSTTDTQQILQLIDPSLIIADEGQNLRGDSAKTKRFWAFVNKRDPKPRGVVMSGTLTATQPLDYHKLITWSMGPNSPLPRPLVHAATWSELLRSKADDPTPAQAAPIMPLVKWAGEWAPTTEGIRKSYRKRLHSSPGFVTSSGRPLGVALEIRNLPAGSRSAQWQKVWNDVENDWMTPNGDVLSHGIELHSTLRELSAGFYYERTWPDHPLTPQAKAHHEAGQEYRKELRQFFGSTLYPRQGLDTPLLVGRHHEQLGVIGGFKVLYHLWQRWKLLEHDDLPDRDSTPVFLDDYKIKAAVAWAKKQKRPGAIMWVHHKAVALWLINALHEEGLPVMRKAGGDNWLQNDGSENYFCVASIRAHGTGKNLQHFQHQYLVQWPRPANACEQLLGRTHRTGQKADRLVVHTNHTLDWDYDQQACTIADTVYQSETLGGRAKLLIADWSPPPPTPDPEFLRSRYTFRGSHES